MIKTCMSDTLDSGRRCRPLVPPPWCCWAGFQLKQQFVALWELLSPLRPCFGAVTGSGWHACSCRGLICRLHRGETYYNEAVKWRKVRWFIILLDPEGANDKTPVFYTYRESNAEDDLWRWRIESSQRLEQTRASIISHGRFSAVFLHFFRVCNEADAAAFLQQDSASHWIIIPLQSPGNENTTERFTCSGRCAERSRWFWMCLQDCADAAAVCDMTALLPGVKHHPYSWELQPGTVWNNCQAAIPFYYYFSPLPGPFSPHHLWQDVRPPLPSPPPPTDAQPIKMLVSLKCMRIIDSCVSERPNRSSRCFQAEATHVVLTLILLSLMLCPSSRLFVRCVFSSCLWFPKGQLSISRHSLRL